MKKYSCQIFIDILLLLGVVYLFSMCSNNNNNAITHINYSINHYIDTIGGHIILTTVCDECNHHISVSTLELNNN